MVLDECLPKRLCRDFVGHDAVTVPMIGLAGIDNGELLRRLAGRRDVFVTIDANLVHQQDLGGLSFATTRRRRSETGLALHARARALPRRSS